MDHPKVSKVLSFLLISLIWFCIGWLVSWQVNIFIGRSSLDANAQRLLTAFNLLSQKQILVDEKLNAAGDKARVEAAIDGMLVWSDDPYADQYGAEASARYQMGVDGEIGQSGIWYHVIDGKYEVTAVPPGSAADKAGILVGDILVGADGVQFDKTISPYEARILQRGPVGSILHLVIERNGQQRQIELIREEWQTIWSRMLAQQIGYLNTQYFFLDYSEGRIKKAIEELQQQQMSALIWDLRGSTGGAMPTVQTVLSYFFKEGLLYTAELHDGTVVPFNAKGQQFVDEKLPIVVLIDHETLSASEVAAAVMSARKRATLIGQPTAGKGLIQETVTIDNDTMLRYSVAKWLAPPLAWTNGTGVMPAIKLENDPTTESDEVLDFAVQYIVKTNLQR